jgi:hypothetical protein
MTTSELIRSPQAQAVGRPRNDVRVDARADARAVAAVEDTFDDVFPLIDLVPVSGPPAIFVAGFASVITLMVCAPLTILLTIVAAGLIVMTGLIALCGAIVLGPLLLLRRVRMGPG